VVEEFLDHKIECPFCRKMQHPRQGLCAMTAADFWDFGENSKLTLICKAVSMGSSA
jgi:hypothetical protein